MLIIGVLLVMWVVLLAPVALRKVRSATSDRSISSFHQSLRTLEGSGSQTIAPAHRLDFEEDHFANQPPVIPVAPRSPIQPGPQLVLLQSDGQGGSAMTQNYQDSEQWDDGYADDYLYEETPQFASHYPADPYARREAALRRRNILFTLVGAVVVTGIFGMLAPFFWDLTILAIVLLVTYVGLMAWAATRGSISISKPRMLGRSDEVGDRHVARAVADHYGARTEGLEWAQGDEQGWDDDQGAPAATYADQFDDGWWEEPRQAAAR